MLENSKTDPDILTMWRLLTTEAPLTTEWKSVVDSVFKELPQENIHLFLSLGSEKSLILHALLPISLLTQIPPIPLTFDTGLTLSAVLRDSQHLIDLEIRYNISHLNILTNG